MSWGPWFPTWLSNSTIAIAKRLALFLWAALHPEGYLKVCVQIPSRTWLCLSRGCKSVWRISRCHPKLSANPHGKGLSWPKDQSRAVGLSYFLTLYLLHYLKSITLPWTDKDDFLQSNNVQTLSLTNKTPWGYSFTCTVAQTVNPCEWNNLQFGVTSQWLCAQLNLIEIEILEHCQGKFK